MKIHEAAKAGITRLSYVKDGKPVWNPYGFIDIHVKDGCYGPWAKVYGPCSMLALEKQTWTPIVVATLAGIGSLHFDTDVDEFEVYRPPADMDQKFPGCPPVPPVYESTR